MEDIFRKVTINHNNEYDEIFEKVLDQQLFPYIISDINLSIDNTSYMYILISIRQRNFVYTVWMKSLTIFQGLCIPSTIIRAIFLIF